MTIKTDFHAVDKHGTRDFVLQCHKRPFAMTVSPLLPKPPENLIDLELVEFLNIPIKKIEARRFSFAGIETRIVGHVSQTVQCVVNGKIKGTTHLKAAVVRHLTSLYNMDCIAGGKTCQQLLSADDFSVKSSVITCSSDGEVSDNSDDEQPVDDDQPVTPSPTKSSASSPRSPSPVPTTPTPRSKPSGATSSLNPSSPTNTDLCDSWCYQGGKQNRFDTRARRPVDKRWHYNAEDEIWTLPYTKLGPVEKPDPPDHTVAYIQLGNEDVLTSFCNVVTDGWPMVASPKKTEPTTISSSTSIQAITSSKYLCADCGNKFSVCQGTCYQHTLGVGDPPYVVGHIEPALPPYFTPCGDYCMYEECECLRRYDGRDWAS